MKLYLTRHGQANRPEVDPEKNLSQKGRADVGRVAAFLETNKNVQVKQVFHSGKSRAQQTAEIMASAIAPGADIVKIDGINPNDPVEPLVDLIETWTEDTQVVGHLPYMANIVSQLVSGDHSLTVMFEAGTTVCLEKLEGHWIILWVVGPGIVP